MARVTITQQPGRSVFDGLFITASVDDGTPFRIQRYELEPAHDLMARMGTRLTLEVIVSEVSITTGERPKEPLPPITLPPKPGTAS